jgi:hypothetical protein
LKSAFSVPSLSLFGYIEIDIAQVKNLHRYLVVAINGASYSFMRLNPKD